MVFLCFSVSFLRPDLLAGPVPVLGCLTVKWVWASARKKSVWLPLAASQTLCLPHPRVGKTCFPRPWKYRRFQCSPHCRGALGLSRSLSHPQSTHSFWLPGSPGVCGTTSSHYVCSVGGAQPHPHCLRRTRRLTGRHGLVWATAVR